MAEEKTYIVPLRREFIKAPKWKRTKKAVNALKAYLKKHTKTEDIKIGKHLNKYLWGHGIKNPPSKVKIKVKKEENKVMAELPEFPFEEKKKEEKKGVATRLKEGLTGKKVPEPRKKEEKPKKVDMSLEKNIKKASKDAVKKAKEKPKEEK